MNNLDNNKQFASKFSKIILIPAIILSSLTAINGKNSFGDIIYFVLEFLWYMIPYVIFYKIASVKKNKSAILTAGLSLIILDTSAHISIFIFPGSSTDVIALFFMPLLLSGIILPLGYMVGLLISNKISVK